MGERTMYKNYRHLVYVALLEQMLVSAEFLFRRRWGMLNLFVSQKFIFLVKAVHSNKKEMVVAL